MTARDRAGFSVAGAATIVLLVFLLWGTFASGGESASAETSTTTTSSSTSTTIPDEYDFVPGVELEKVVVELLQDAGFDRDEFVIGEEEFDLSLPAVNSAGNGSFSSKPITSSQELDKFLNGGSVEANRVIGRVMESTGATKTVVTDLTNWVGVQFLIPTDWSGNTYFKDGKIVPASEVRKSENGDIAWFFVDPQDLRTGRIVVAESESLLVLRGPCGNPQTVPPTPPTTVTTTKPPSTTVTTQPGTTTTVTTPGTTTTVKPTTTTTVKPGTTTTVKPTTTTTVKPTTTTTVKPTTTTTVKPTTTTTVGGKGSPDPTVYWPKTTEPTRSPTTTTTKPSTTTTATTNPTTVVTIPYTPPGAVTTVAPPTTQLPPSTIPGTTQTTIEGYVDY